MIGLPGTTVLHIPIDSFDSGPPQRAMCYRDVPFPRAESSLPTCKKCRARAEERIEYYRWLLGRWESR